MTIKKNHIIRTVFSVTGLLIVSKLLGFVKQMVTAAAFGTTIETDLISLSQGLIGNIQYLLVESVLSALVAVYLLCRVQVHGTAGGGCGAPLFL